MVNNNIDPVIILRDGTELSAEWAEAPKTSLIGYKPTEDTERLFYSNIPLFYNNIERILSDSKLFLTPIAVNNGLAISGRFEQATLGVYIEWWIYNYYALSVGSYPIWKVAASGLSGGHACKAVNERGEPIDAVLRGCTSQTWKSFMAENKRYREAKNHFKAYTLEQAIELLKNE